MISWHEIDPSETLRSAAMTLIERYDLRAADALQLAAALEAASGAPASLPFICLDTRLRAAATLEGFGVLP